MSTTYAPRSHVRRPHGALWLVVGIGLLAVVIGLGAWAVYDLTSASETTATQVIDDATAAWIDLEPGFRSTSRARAERELPRRPA